MLSINTYAFYDAQGEIYKVLKGPVAILQNVLPGENYVTLLETDPFSPAGTVEFGVFIMPTDLFIPFYTGYDNHLE
jgi:hypothetical protein